LSTLIVGVGDLAASNSAEDIIKTFALGSCVGVIVTAPAKGAAGLLHVALPDSRINPQLALLEPGRFADTGVPALLQAMRRYGCETRDLIVKLAGGSNILDEQNRFEIGKRNILAIKKVLWMYRLGAIAEDLGGNISRTVTVRIHGGGVLLSTPGREDKLL